MTVEVFLDTNIVVYAMSGAPQEAAKRARSFDIMRSEKFGISAQVLQEFYVTVTRKSRSPVEAGQAMDWLQRMVKFPVLPIDAQLVQQAITVAQRFQISYWDGAIIAAAQEMGAAILYTEDLNSGQRYGAIQAINPFT